MARPGVTYEEVLAAIETVVANNERPTINRVRSSLGDRGSTTTIGRYIKQWRQKHDLLAQGDGDGHNQAKPQQNPDETERQASASPQAKPAAGKQEQLDFAVSGNHNDADKSREKSKPAGTSSQLKGHAKAGSGEQERGASKVDGDGTRRAPKTFRKISSGNSATVNGKAHKKPNNQRRTFESCILEQKPEELEQKPESELVSKIRRLESELFKEQSRRESAERMALEAKQYAEVLKQEIGNRVSDVKNSMEYTVEQLKVELKEAQKRSDDDVEYYRQQLAKANQRLMQLLGEA